MNTIDKQIEILQAFKEGKKIEILCDDDLWAWVDKSHIFDFEHNEYRIKPEPKLRPYKDAEEFLTAIKEHGILKSYGLYYQPIFFDDKGVIIYAGSKIESYDFVELNEYFAWQDGSPCGVEED